MQQRIHSGWKFWLATLLLFTITGSEKCFQSADPEKITVPICACVLRGVSWTRDGTPESPLRPSDDSHILHSSNASITNKVVALINSASDEIWVPGADIALLPILKKDGFIPLIDDPDPGFGFFGDVLGERPNADIEVANAANHCRQAWGDEGITDGVILVIARKFTQSGGRPSTTGGISIQKGEWLTRNDGSDYCNFPMHLNKEDAKGRYMVIEEPALFSKFPGLPTSLILAHEFGHVLFLGHGDGLDNDQVGKILPLEGPRKFDEYCDPDEFRTFDLVSTTTQSLMSVTPTTITITPLQKAVARSTAVLFPGAVGGP